MVDIAVVTGSSGGIGAAICRKLSDLGFTIAALYGHNHEAAAELEGSIVNCGGSCYTYSADLSSSAGIDQACGFISEIMSRFPSSRLRVLVNNAALLLSPAFRTTRPEDFDAYFSINAKAPFFLSQRLIGLMTSGASIINLSSANAHFSSPGDITYAMSKAAIESFTRNLAEAVAPQGIRVNAVIPGFTDNGHAAFQNEAVREYMSSFAIMGGVSQPETIAEAVAFLASPASNRTTGALLDVTGGSLLGARGHRPGSVRDLLS